MNIASIAVTVAISVLMLYTGLLFDPSLFRQRVLRSNLRQFGRLVFANYVIIPSLVLGAAWLLYFPPSLAIALLTLAVFPCAPPVPALVGAFGEQPGWSLFVFLSLSVLNIALLPVLFLLLSLPGAPWTTGSHMHLAGGWSAFITYAISVYVPMGVGAGIRIFAPKQFSVCQRLLGRVLPTLWVVTLVLFVHAHQEEMLSIGPSELAALALFELICILVALTLLSSNAGRRISNIMVSSLFMNHSCLFGRRNAPCHA